MQTTRYARLLLPALAALVLLAGCASNKDREQTEQEIYADARDNLERGNFTTAQARLEELETRFPFGRYSSQAQLDMVYAQMRALDYPGAVTTATRFLRQYPSDPNADYALYLRGLANYWMNSGILVRRSPADPALRDLTSLRDSYGDFGALIARHPQSPYAPDARSRMLYLRNLLAEQEAGIAWYYVRRGACVAAINRARYLLENFPSAPAQGDALVIASECSHRIGETVMADRFLAVLKKNFPDHPRLRADGTLDVPEGRSIEGPPWWKALSFGLFD